MPSLLFIDVVQLSSCSVVVTLIPLLFFFWQLCWTAVVLVLLSALTFLGPSSPVWMFFLWFRNLSLFILFCQLLFLSCRDSLFFVSFTYTSCSLFCPSVVRLMFYLYSSSSCSWLLSYFFFRFVRHFSFFFLLSSSRSYLLLVLLSSRYLFAFNMDLIFFSYSSLFRSVCLINL